MVMMRIAFYLLAGLFVFPNQDCLASANHLFTPLTSRISPELPNEWKKEIPDDLKLKDEKAARLQAELFRDFGIFAQNKTDEHSVMVLRHLIFLLRNAFPDQMAKKMKSFRYLYAYKGHDRFFNLAAYHEKHGAVSVGGKSTYPNDIDGIDVQLLSTLAHEIGHAFLFENLSPLDLRKISADFGGWKLLFSDKEEDSLFAKSFLSPHPLVKRGRKPSAVIEQSAFSPKAHNHTSGLAAKNIHEWFADAFAAAALVRLGKGGKLGSNWRDRLISVPKQKGEHWVDYNNISDEFSAWLENKSGQGQICAENCGIAAR